MVLKASFHLHLRLLSFQEISSEANLLVIAFCTAFNFAIFYVQFYKMVTAILETFSSLGVQWEIKSDISDGFVVCVEKIVITHIIIRNRFLKTSEIINFTTLRNRF